MLDLAQIDDLAHKTASTVLKQAEVERVFSEPAVECAGKDALRITIVLKPGNDDDFSGDQVLQTLVGIDRALQAANDDRFPIIIYTTEETLASSDDPES